MLWLIQGNNLNFHLINLIKQLEEKVIFYSEPETVQEVSIPIQRTGKGKEVSSNIYWVQEWLGVTVRQVERTRWVYFTPKLDK